jgi:sensor domain CHASE-containing protein/GGDEF domain-containing protein
VSKIDMQLGKTSAAAPHADHASDRPVGTIALRDIVMPLAIIAALLVLVLTLGVHYAVTAFDAGNEQRERVLASNGIEQRIEEVALMVVPQADWDDAVTHLDHRFDAEWSRANIGSYLFQTNGFDRAFVLNRDNRLLEAYRLGSAVPPASYASAAPQFAELVKAVRALEAKRAPYPVGPHQKMISSPIQASAFKVVDGALTIATATLVQPDFGTALPKGPRAPIVITTMPINDAFLKVFSRRYLLRDLHLLPAGQTPRDHENAIPIDDEQGRVLAALAWMPLAPGYSMLRELILPVSAVSVLLIALASWQLWQIRRMAGALIEREGFWREVASREPATDLLDRPGFLEQLAFELVCLGEISQTLSVLAIRIQSAEGTGTAREHERFCQIAISRLKRVCRDDAIIARISENEFAILAVGADEHGAKALRTRAVAVLATPFSIGGVEFDPQPQVGMAVVGTRATSAAAVLAQARADTQQIAI